MRDLLVMLVIAAGAVAPAWAVDAAAAQELAKASGCLSCHAATEKVVGPAYVKVAEKYAGESDAAASIAQSIQYGSKGKWGRIPMPAHPSLSADDLKTLAEWILAAKP
ncbi:MAG: cytochrome C' [Burkholderiales bacterium 66-5]|nr:MAG: cytochrome C' [Burkholderiales bacterium 66-5]